MSQSIDEDQPESPAGATTTVLTVPAAWVDEFAAPANVVLGYD